MASILITGASGFVGGFLVEEALNRGLEVYAAIRKTSNTEYLQDPRIQIVYFNFNDIDEMSRIIRDHNFDYIIHNAGLTKSPSKEAYFKVNRDFLSHLVTAITRSKTEVKKLTFISSLAAFGPAEYTANDLVTNETTPHPVTNYGRSKLAAEEYLKEQSDVKYIIIRPTAVYGPREKDLFTVYSLINKGLNMSVGLKDAQLTFIYVKDLVKTVLNATISDHSNKAYFISDGAVYSTSMFNNEVKKALGKQRTLNIKLPILLVKVIATVSEAIGKLTKNYPPLNKEKVNELEAKSWSLDISPLEQDFDYTPEYDLSKGLQESIAWYKNNNWL